jgi:hypothetical protein
MPLSAAQDRQVSSIEMRVFACHLPVRRHEMLNELMFDTDLERLWYRRPKRISHQSLVNLRIAIGFASGVRLGLSQRVIDGAAFGVVENALEYAAHIHENSDAIPRKGRRVALSALVLLPSAHRGDRTAARRLAAIFELTAAGQAVPEMLATLGACWRERLQVLANDWLEWNKGDRHDGTHATATADDRYEADAAPAADAQPEICHDEAPSQDEIMASIRRIICEDGTPRIPGVAAAEPPPSEMEPTASGTGADDRVRTNPRSVRVLLNDMPQSELPGAVDLKRYAGLFGFLPVAAPPLPSALDALNRDYPHFAEVTRDIRRELELALMAGAERFRLAPRLLVGPPGAGKSRYLRALGETLGRPVRALSAAANDARALIGTARGWATAVPSFPLNAMTDVYRADPLLIVDEIEKADRRDGLCGLQSGLLGMMEPATSAGWYDECLMVYCDLSWVGWMLTANSLSGVSPPLLDRCRVHYVSGPQPEHFDAYVRTILVDIAGDLGVPTAQLPQLEPVIYEALRRAFGRNPTLRSLKRTVGLVLSVAPRAALH